MENTEILERMANSNPYKSYKKTIAGKVYVQYLDPFSHEQLGTLLSGDPTKEEGIFNVWSNLENTYFKQMNKRLFEMGYLVEYTKPVVFEKSPNEKTDDEIEALFDEKFLTFQSEVKKVTSEVTLQRMLVIGENKNKSPKYLEFIRNRLVDIQQNEFSSVIQDDTNSD
ncbi:MAG: hypothetical protein ACUVRK_12345 [Spirochaetota bacterium]